MNFPFILRFLDHSSLYCDITHMDCSVWDCFSCDAYKKWLVDKRKECEKVENKVDTED